MIVPAVSRSAQRGTIGTIEGLASCFTGLEDPRETVSAALGGVGSMPEEPVPVRFRGVNLSGAEFGSLVPGSEGTDYTWPTTDEVDYFISKGMNTFRVNFVWERLQPAANGPLATTYAAELEALVK